MCNDIYIQTTCMLFIHTQIPTYILLVVVFSNSFKSRIVCVSKLYFRIIYIIKLGERARNSLFLSLTHSLTLSLSIFYTVSLPLANPNPNSITCPNPKPLSLTSSLLSPTTPITLKLQQLCAKIMT